MFKGKDDQFKIEQLFIACVAAHNSTFLLWQAAQPITKFIIGNSCSITIQKCSIPNRRRSREQLLTQNSKLNIAEGNHSTLPPAWFRSTDLSLFNHTCFYLMICDIYNQVSIRNLYLLQIHTLFQSICIYPANMKNLHVLSRLFGKDVYI